MHARSRTPVLMLFWASLAAPAWADNVALGKPVTLNGVYGTNGTFCGSPLPAAAATLTDGVFLPESTCWQVDSVWWNGADYPANSIVVDLGATYALRRLSVQADNNDTYRVEVLDSGGNWVVAWDVPDVCCYGMTTRQTTLAQAIEGSALRFTATGGDNLYSVSEIQAATTVPEPASWLMLGAGIAALARRRGR